jgi:hypothetical protein
MDGFVWVFFAVAFPILGAVAVLKTGENVEILDQPSPHTLTTVRKGSRVTTRTVAAATPAWQ